MPEHSRETRQHLRGAARTLRYVARQGRDVIDREAYADALQLTVELYELAEEIERARGPHRVRQLISRATRRLDEADRTIAEIECVIDTGSEAFASAECPDCEQMLAIPRTGPVACKLCRSEWTRQEVFLQ